MAKYMVRAPQFRPMSDGDSTSLGTIEISQPGNSWALVEITGTDTEVQQKINDAITQGQIIDFKPESTLYPLGVVYPPLRESRRFGILGARAVENRMGLDFSTIGITPEWQEIVQAASERIVAVCDTGRVPEAARDAHMPHVELIHVYGGNDTHGHSTACVSRIIGTRGVLNQRRRLITAQALPNGSGTTTDIVNAIRAARNWRGPNGERVSVISLSLGMDGRDQIIDREIIDTQNQGVVCVAAIGNSGWNLSAAGTPVAVCNIGVGATVFDGTAPANFSSGGCNFVEETGPSPGQDVGLAHLDGGYGLGAGSSFSCPVIAAVTAGMLSLGWTITEINRYLLENQRAFNPPRRRGLIQLHIEDFRSENGGTPMPDTDHYFDEIKWRAQEMDNRLAQAQNFREALQNGTMDWDTLFNSNLGPGRDLMREIAELSVSGKA